MSSLGDVGEFGFIDRLSRLFPSSANVLEGIGDDCAVVQCGTEILLLASDISIEGRHFVRAWAAPEDIGYKAAVCTLSDMAAMGGVPEFALISFASDESATVEFLEGIARGIADAMERAGAVVVGGDMSSADGIVIDVAMAGRVVAGRYLTRKGARDGDVIAVTGALGASAAGLHAMQNGHDSKFLRDAHFRPTPRLEEGRWFAGRDEVHAMIDVSDGAAQDTGHIAERSGVGIDIDSTSLPIGEETRDYCEDHSVDPVGFACFGGEDFELALAIDGDSFESLRAAFMRRFTTPLTRIGACTSGHTGVRIDGAAPGKAGFDHFSKRK